MCRFHWAALCQTQSPVTAEHKKDERVQIHVTQDPERGATLSFQMDVDPSPVQQSTILTELAATACIATATTTLPVPAKLLCRSCIRRKQRALFPGALQVCTVAVAFVGSAQCRFHCCGLFVTACGVSAGVSVPSGQCCGHCSLHSSCSQSSQCLRAVLPDNRVDWPRFRLQQEHIAAVSVLLEALPEPELQAVMA